jgi:outer membrane protein TolC
MQTKYYRFRIARLLIVLTIAAINQLHAQEANIPQKLSGLIRSAIENNIDIKSARYEFEQSERRSQKTGSGLLPQVNGFISADDYFELPRLIIPGEIVGRPDEKIPVEFGTKYDIRVGARVDQKLYDQPYFELIKIASLSRDLHETGIERAERQVAGQVANIYYTAVAAKFHVELIGSSLGRMRRLCNLARTKYENGMISRTDFERIDVRINNLINRKTQAETELSEKIRFLEYICGKSGEIEIDENINGLEEQIAESQGEGNIIELQQLRLRKNIAEKNCDMILGGYLPSVSAYASFTWQAQRNQFDIFESNDEDKWFKIGVVGLSVSIPMFDGFAKSADIQEAKIEKEKLERRICDTEDYYRLRLANAEKRIESAREISGLQKANLQQAENLYERAKLSYEQGAAALTELLEIEKSMFESKALYIESLAGCRMAEIEMLRAKGKFSILYK